MRGDTAWLLGWLQRVLTAGSNVTLNNTVDGVEIASSGGGSQNVFSTIAVSGQSDVVADSTTDTLTLAAGSNITLTTNAGTDTITIASTGGGTTDHTALSNIGTNTHAQIDSHLASTSNPHSVTKTQVGLANADNTSDANKPISTATQTALDLKAPLASPTFTGIVTLPTATVTLANMADIATDSFIGRDTAGAGVPEVLSAATVKTILAIANTDVSGLGTLATQSGTFSGTSSGTNTGDQTITLTGDVTGSGTGSFAATIANDAVTFAKMQTITDARLLGRSAGSDGDCQHITVGAGLSLSGGELSATGGGGGISVPQSMAIASLRI